MISFRVYGEPQPFPKKQINRHTGAVYPRDPTGAKIGWMDAIRFTCHEAMKAKGWKIFPDNIPLALEIAIFRTKPKTWNKRDKGDYQAPFTKPDVDNFAYSVTNALINVAYVDDARVCTLRVKKQWADEGQRPGVFVKISEDE